MSRTEISLSAGQQQTITVRNFVVPQRKDGMKVRYTIRAMKDTTYGKRKRRRREAPPTGNQGKILFFFF